MNNKNKLILPLLIGFSCLVSCNNDPRKTYTVKIYDYSSSSSYTEYKESSSIKVKEGDTLSYPSNPSRKTFQKFVGWTLDKEHTKFCDFNQPITSDISIYANYTKKDERVLYVDYDDGVTRWGIHKKGDEVAKKQIPTPETTQWEFSDWFSDKGYNYAAKFPLVLDDDQYLYAYYKEREFSVTFHYNGGMFPKVSKTQLVKYGKCAEYFVPPAKKTQKFLGWYTEETLENKFDFETKIISKTELWGKWETA